MVELTTMPEGAKIDLAVFVAAFISLKTSTGGLTKAESPQTLAEHPITSGGTEVHQNYSEQLVEAGYVVPITYVKG